MEHFRSLSILAMIGLVDSISYMAVAPSLIFYVLQVGGDKEIYGLIISVFSFASFCGKPLYGIWVDWGDNKFRLPYITSLLLAILGGILYCLGNAATTTSKAIALIFIGRLFSGLGGANQTLGYAYIASVIPQDQQTKTNTLLSMMRIIGMASGPLVNLLLAKIHTTLSIGSFTIVIDPLNSVGILLALGNSLVLLGVFVFLDEPPESVSDEKPSTDSSKNQSERQTNNSERGRFWKDVFQLEILLPILILFVVNSSFQLIETAFPVAAADGLGWGPVETSVVLGSMSVVIFFFMIATVYLSEKIHDLTMVALGNVFWVVGGFGMYFFWRRDVSFYNYAIPIIVACAGFPFIAASNRSNFTRAVGNSPGLVEFGGFMQSVLSMSSSVAGFITPGFVASFVLRNPDEISSSTNDREMTPIALYVCLLPIPILLALWFQYKKEVLVDNRQSDEESMATEESSLLHDKETTERRRSSIVMIEQALSRGTSVNQRISGQMMGGLTAYETKEEQKLHQQLEKDLKAWQSLAELDYNDEEQFHDN